MLEGGGKKEERRNTEDKKQSEGGIGGFGKADRLTPGVSRTKGGERMRRQTGKRPCRLLSPAFQSLPPFYRSDSESTRLQLLLLFSLSMGGCYSWEKGEGERTRSCYCQ